MLRFLLLVLPFAPCIPASGTGNHLLWYAYPAKYWNSQALHLGNGYMGASFFGGVEQERFALAEQSIWTGSPARGDWESVGVNPRAKEALPGIREAVVAGRIGEADRLIREQFLGTTENFGHFSSVGDLLLDFEEGPKGVSGYRRELDLAQALGRVKYERDGVRFQREYFCSYPDRVLALRLSASEPGSISLSLGTRIVQEEFAVDIEGNTYRVRGKVDDNKRPFVVLIKVIQKGGSLGREGDRLSVKGADTVEVLLTITTNYRLGYPDYVGADPLPLAESIIDSARALGYEQLRKRHIADYRELYDRVYLDLRGDPEWAALPTNERFQRLRRGRRDRGYFEMAANLGRYMIISSSRPGTLPANLQGVWNAFQVAPWAGNYQSNINLQLIYWSCGSMDLRECSEPLLDWIEDLAHSGREVARRVYGTGGWVSHTTGNIWGHAAPFGGIRWGMFPSGAAWHCQHLWDHYLYTGDWDYLRNRAYPLMKAASQFWLENLVPFGLYSIIAPTVSAEHGALLTDDGLNPSFHDFKSDDYLHSLPGVYQDIQMVHGLFTQTATAAKLMGEYRFADQLERARDGLLPLQIGSQGQLQEWFQDIDRPDCHHRHIAHLYAVCPGTQIHPTRTPELAEAARVSLNWRGDGRFPKQELAAGGNWSRAHRMWSWARLMDGDRALKILHGMLTEQGFENGLTFQHADYHWEQGKDFQREDQLYLHYQLDGSASVPGLIAEMLLQTHMGEIHLLPALPAALPSGVIRGLKGRGGFTFDIEWWNGELLRATIYVPEGVQDIPPVRLGHHIEDLSRQNRIKFERERVGIR